MNNFTSNQILILVFYCCLMWMFVLSCIRTGISSTGTAIYYCTAQLIVALDLILSKKKKK